MIDAVDLGAVMACAPREASDWRDLAAMLAFVLLARAWRPGQGRLSSSSGSGETTNSSRVAGLKRSAVQSFSSS